MAPCTTTARGPFGCSHTQMKTRENAMKSDSIPPLYNARIPLEDCPSSHSLPGAQDSGAGDMVEMLPHKFVTCQLGLNSTSVQCPTLTPQHELFRTLPGKEAGIASCAPSYLIIPPRPLPPPL